MKRKHSEETPAASSCTGESPCSPGLYLAFCGRGGTAGRKRRWTLVVHVFGEFPFLRLTAWDWESHIQKDDFDPRTVTAWGPRIDVEANAGTHVPERSGGNVQ